MKVNSTELQNNFGKYLMLTGKEDIIITRNGMEIARLSSISDRVSECGAAPSAVMEKAENYRYGDRRASYGILRTVPKFGGKI